MREGLASSATLFPQVKEGDVAQLVEHLLCKQGVGGSSPLVSTIETEADLPKGVLGSRLGTFPPLRAYPSVDVTQSKPSRASHRLGHQLWRTGRCPARSTRRR